jgi:hypothetical protein
MKSQNASSLGYTMLQVVGHYNLFHHEMYQTLCTAENLSYKIKRDTGNQLLTNEYTHQAGQNLLNEANQEESIAKEKCDQLYQEYQQKMGLIAQNWDQLRICCISGSFTDGQEKMYFQVPYCAIVIGISNTLMYDFMGKIYSAEEIEYQTALSVDLQSQWEMLDISYKNRHVKASSVQNLTWHREPDSDGDVVYGKHINSNKIEIGSVQGNVIPGDKTIHQSSTGFVQINNFGDDFVGGRTFVGDKVVGRTYTSDGQGDAEIDSMFGDDFEALFD